MSVIKEGKELLESELEELLSNDRLYKLYPTDKDIIKEEAFSTFNTNKSYRETEEDCVAYGLERAKFLVQRASDKNRKREMFGKITAYCFMITIALAFVAAIAYLIISTIK